MIPSIELWIASAWLALTVAWVVWGFTSKRSVRVQTGGSRLFQLGLVFVGLMLIFNFNGWFVSGWATVRLMPRTEPFVLGCAIFTLGGMLFSVWARLTLGSNWSGTVTIKENHELIRKGPYQIVRHPIYTGLLIALLGTAFVYGLTRCFAGVLVVGFAFWLKSQTEEQFMVQQFGQQYLNYRQQVRALIPYVL